MRNYEESYNIKADIHYGWMIKTQIVSIKKCPKCYHYFLCHKKRIVRHLCKTKLKNRKLFGQVKDRIPINAFLESSANVDTNTIIKKYEKLFSWTFTNDDRSHILLFFLQLRAFYKFEFRDIMDIINESYPINLERKK